MCHLIGGWFETFLKVCLGKQLLAQYTTIIIINYLAAILPVISPGKHQVTDGKGTTTLSDMDFCTAECG